MELEWRFSYVLYQVPDNVMEPRDVGKGEPEPASLADDFIEGNEDDLDMIKQVEELRLKLTELELKLCEVSLPQNIAPLL